MSLDKRNGYWVSQLSNANDPIRTSHWKLNFNFKDLINYEKQLGYGSNVFGGDVLSLAVKDYTPPTVEIISSTIHFLGGSAKTLPVVHNYEDSLTVTLLESNNLACHKTILRWMQYCINDYSISTADIGKDKSTFNEDNYSKLEGYGAPIYKNQDLYSQFDNSVHGNFFVNHNVVYADTYDYTTGEIIMRVRYVNIYPVKVSPPKMEHSSSNLYEFTVEFKFSRFIYVLPNTDSSSRVNNDYNSQNTGDVWGRNDSRTWGAE